MKMTSSTTNRRDFLLRSGVLLGGTLVGGGSLLNMLGCTDLTTPSNAAWNGSFDVFLRENSTSVVDRASGRLTTTDLGLNALNINPEQLDGELSFSLPEPTTRSAFVDPGAAPLAEGVFADFGIPGPGFYIRYRGADRDAHPLTPCVNQVVRHVHVTVKRSSSTRDEDAWMKLHLGKYTDERGRTCFVVYDSQHKWICFKPCSIDRSSLKGMVEAALATGLAAVGVRAASWVIASTAAVVADSLYLVLLAL